MSGRRYILSRPRTKIYDHNYTMGERYYKPTLDSLDSRTSRSSGSGAEPSVSFAASPAPSRRRSIDDTDDYGDDGMSETLRRVRASRAAIEDDVRHFEENASHRAANRARLDISERLMDAVGINTNGMDEMSVRKPPRRAISEIEDDPFFKKRTLPKDSDHRPERWTKLDAANKARIAALNGLEDLDFDAAAQAAATRAKQSRARILEIENEMEELSTKAKARTARRANAAAVLAESQSLDDTASSAVTKSIRVKRTTISDQRSVM